MVKIIAIKITVLIIEILKDESNIFLTLKNFVHEIFNRISILLFKNVSFYLINLVIPGSTKQYF